MPSLDTCPVCGCPAVEWEKNPFGYTYCSVGHAWRLKPLQVKYMRITANTKFGDKRIAFSLCGWQIIRKHNPYNTEIIGYIPPTVGEE